MNKKVIYKRVAALMLFVILFQTCINTYAWESKKRVYDAEIHTENSQRLKEEFSKNENVVTEYVNEEDGKLKTIIWTKGITPPKMGGQNSDFEKEITNVGNVRFVEYKSPYIEGQGWYDVNKTENRVPDENLCFAAAASNTLHWWLAQNSEYIDQYLEQTPDAPKAEEIKNLKHSFKSQQSSDIYKIFVRQFANKREGYWPDILQDQFINGYYPKKNGGTNDSDEAREELISKGPDKNGGFFYRIFGTTLLTKRHNYYQGYEAISRDIKHYFQNGDIVLLTYNMKTKSHVVTLWGAEFDSDGKISAVYFSDSDDDKKYGMQRYKIVNVGGKAIATTRNDGQGSLVESLQIISTGKKIWEDKLNLSKTQLELIWGDTNFIYNGEPQKPTLTAANIKDGDDITLSAEGDKTDAGTYTATAVLGGAAADHYELPPEYTKQFTIQKAPTKVALSADVQNENHSNQVHFEVNIAGVNDEVLEGSIIFKDGDTVIAKDVPVSDGKASYVWKSPEVGRHYIVAEFLPASDGAGKNYRNTASQVVNVDVSKIEQSTLSIQPVTDKIYGDKPFALATQGGSGTGKVKFESSDPDILSIAENIATIHKAGTVTINAIKAGDKTYHSATATYKMDVKKAPAPEIAYPVAGNLTYGQKLSDSTLIGGSTQYGSFAWENEELIPAVSNNGYNVKFTPNAHTLENYETIESMTSKIQVPVTKANPTVVLTSEVENEAGSKKVLLSASVENVGYGDEPAGTVKFVDCSNGVDVALGDAVAVENGVATYSWTDMLQKRYQIKAIYNGDENYTQTSSAEVCIDVTKKTQSYFEIVPIHPITYGDEPFILFTKGGDGSGTVQFESSDSDILSIAENIATIHTAGAVTVTATKSGDADYNETKASITVEIHKKLLTITAEDKLNIVAGSQMPQFTYKVQGLEVGDVFTIEPIMTTQAENTSGVGEHEIVISGGDLTNRESYQIVYVNGKMTIIDNREDTTIIEDIPKEEGKKETEALNYIEESNISSAEVNAKSTSAKTKLNVMKSQGTPSDPVNTKDLSYVEDKGLQNNQKVLATVLVCAALVGVGAVSIRIFRKRRSRK